MARAPAQRAVRCYLCGNRFEVSPRALSTSCPGCNKAIKIEDVVITSYLPVIEVQTCGRLTVSKRGRVAATHIQCGEGIDCEGVMEGTIETDGDVTLGPHAMWKGKVLKCRRLTIAPGARLVGAINVPWKRPETKKKSDEATEPKKSDEATKRRSDEGKARGGRREAAPKPGRKPAAEVAPKPEKKPAAKPAARKAASPRAKKA
jgi:cytoskeletal protein CcmA (bactofilin family)